MRNGLARRLRDFVGLGVVIVGCNVLPGCAEDHPMDQSSKRLAEMPYTLEIVQTELVSSFSALRTGVRKAYGGQSSGEQGRSSGNGPGDNPVSLETIAEDSLRKLKTVNNQPVATHIDELERRLATEKKLSPQDVQKIISALRTAASKSTP